MIITEFGCDWGISLVEIWRGYVLETSEIELGFIFFADVLTDTTLFDVDLWESIFAGPFFY